MHRTITLSLTVLATLLLAALAAPALAGTAWYPEGTWNGTAPFCDGDCSSTQFAWCVGQNPGCAYSSVYSPSGFGDYCSSGRKAYCVSTGTFPQVTDYNRLNEAGSWNGTAPACSGDCGEGYFALCRSQDGDSCDYAGGIDASKLSGFGDDCSSGRKAFCVPVDYIHN